MSEAKDRRRERFSQIGATELEFPLVMRGGRIALQLSSQSALSAGSEGLAVLFDPETLEIVTGSPRRLRLNTKAAAKAVLAATPAISVAFAVGAVYINVTGVNPATELGYGRWTAFGAGRVMVGVDSGNAAIDAAEKTTGAATVVSTGSVAAPTISGSVAAEATHTHSVTSNVTVADHAAHTHSVTSNVAVGDHAAHTHDAGTLLPSAHAGSAIADHSAHTHSVTSNVTVADHTAHTHTFTQSANAATPDLLTVNTAAAGVAASGTTGNPNATLTHVPTNNAVTSGNPSATLTHGVTQPSAHTMAGTSANPSATLSHAVTNNAVTSGNPSATQTHTPTNNAVTSGAGASHLHAAGTLAASAPAFTGSASSVVQPSIAVHFWRRVA